MRSIKIIRKKLGISQQQIAQYLRISRSLAAHHENGIRTLPTHASLLLARLEIMIMEFEQKQDQEKLNNANQKSVPGEIPVEIPAHETDPLTMPLHPRVALEQDKTERLHQQLATIRTKHESLKQKELLINYLVENCQDSGTEKEKLWLRMLYHNISCKAERFNDEKQLPYKAKILEMQLKRNYI